MRVRRIFLVWGLTLCCGAVGSGQALSEHASHQVGLDADIRLPNRLFTRQEREDMIAVSMLRDPLNVDLSRWTPLHTRLIKLAASYPEVERIFVHPAIKQVLCDQAGNYFTSITPRSINFFIIRRQSASRNGQIERID